MVPETGVQIHHLDALFFERSDDVRLWGPEREQDDGEGAAVVLGQMFPVADQLLVNRQAVLLRVMCLSSRRRLPFPQVSGVAGGFRNHGRQSTAAVEEQMGNMQLPNKRRPPG